MKCETESQNFHSGEEKKPSNFDTSDSFCLSLCDSWENQTRTRRQHVLAELVGLMVTRSIVSV